VIHLRLIDGADSRELRRRVLRPQCTPADRLPGDDLPNAVHLGAIDERGTIVGACFVAPEPCPWRSDGADAWRLRSMATEPARQREGIGSAVLDAAITHVAALGVPLLWCHAREPAIRFYEQHGFVGAGDIYRDPETGLPHLHMARELPGDPASSG
jgi:GNAT superfamily N-acetyltransferase